MGSPAGSESSAKFHVFVKDFGVAFSKDKREQWDRVFPRVFPCCVSARPLLPG